MTKNSNTEKLKAIMASPELWCKCFLKITDKQGRSVPFEFNPQQMELVRGLEKYNIVLKSRQLGITSAACALSLYYCHREPNVTCLLMSYSQDSARGIFAKLKDLWQSIPDCVRQKDIANNRSELRFANGSQILVCVCGGKQVARGLTIKFAHLSEVAFFDEERSQKNLLALEQALRPDGVIVLESTANGFNHFSELWDKAASSENMYCPHFYGWVQDKRMFAAEYQQFAKRWIAKHGSLPISADLDAEEQALMEHGATIEQIVWRRLKISNSSPEQFRQEFPATPDEAFTTSGENVFDAAVLHERSIAAHKALSTPAEFAGMGITFWELPRPEKRYYIGVDTSEGLGGNKDYSAIEVISNDLYQCAELYSNKIKPHKLAETLLKLARYYNGSLCVIEKASGGHVVLDRMKNLYHYPNLFKSKQYDSSGMLKRKVGWETTKKTRPVMIGDFVELWENNDCWINSRQLLKEMQTFVDKDGRIEHAGRHGDDCIFAFAMALQGHKSGLWYF